MPAPPPLPTPRLVQIQRGVPAPLIFSLRVAALEAQLLPTLPWRNGFTIWSAGREGRRLYRALSPRWRDKVGAFPVVAF